MKLSTGAAMAMSPDQTLSGLTSPPCLTRKEVLAS